MRLVMPSPNGIIVILESQNAWSAVRVCGIEFDITHSVVGVGAAVEVVVAVAVFGLAHAAVDAVVDAVAVGVAGARARLHGSDLLAPTALVTLHRSTPAAE